MKLLKVVTSLAVMASAVWSLNQRDHIPNHLERVQERGELVVVSRNGPTTYYETEQGLNGYDVELLEHFADNLGVSLRVVDETLVDHLYDQVTVGTADFGAANLAISDHRQSQVRYTQHYRHQRPVAIYRTGHKRPKSLADLNGKDIHVIGGRHKATMIQQLASQQGVDLNIVQHNDIEMIDLLEMIHQGDIKIAIVDQASFDLNHVLFPRTRVAFNLPEDLPVAWAFKPSKDRSLYDAANQYLTRIKLDGTLEAHHARHSTPNQNLAKAGASLFVKRLNERLPKYLPLFMKASEIYGPNWEFIAAVAYQESHWDPKAKSPTGVRGMMMLTRRTAKEMKIKDRTDAAQSVDGGVRYFLKLKKRLPERIREPDRTFFALASYNVGYGHLEDARVLTSRDGKNPDKWADVREYLPLLQQSKYYRTVKHGFARGSEPVTYVERIRSYQRALEWNSKMQKRAEQQLIADNPSVLANEHAPILALF